jgi:hypothetical protein
LRSLPMNLFVAARQDNYLTALALGLLLRI